jgi:preprotein translocase subunit YajC
MFSATLPTVLVVVVVYTLWMRRTMKQSKASTVAPTPSASAE